MAIEITQAQQDSINQTLRNLHIKIDILNFSYQPVASLDGNIISGSITIDANSDLRRSCNISLVVTDSSFNVEAGGKIYLDKLFKIQVGIDEFKTGDISWTNMGIFLINQPSYSYDATTHTLSFDGVDLMALFTGLRNGYIAGMAGTTTAILQQGQNVREVIIAIVKQNGFTRYVVNECTNADGSIQAVPYDMEFSQGATWFDMLSTLRDILPNYQIYFDANGVFHYEPIPSSANDPILIDDTVWANNVISEQVDVDFESVKNYIEVYGATHDTTYFSSSTSSAVSGNTITLTVDGSYSGVDYTQVSFVLPSAASGNITVNVNNTGAANLVNSNGAFITSLSANVYYTISMQTDGTWLFMGHLQAQGLWYDNNPDSPFYYQGPMGSVVLPLYGSDYENIQTDELALERAKYEGYKRCRLNDSITLSTVPIYWADVNWRCSYKPLGGDTTNQYITQSIRIDLAYNGQQTWTLSRFYPLYPII